MAKQLIVAAAVAVGFLFVDLHHSLAAPNNLVSTVAREGKLSTEKAEETVALVFSALRGELTGGRPVTVTNFGRFFLHEAAPRKGRNPRTGAALDIPAKRYARFSAADRLREQVNSTPVVRDQRRTQSAAANPTEPAQSMAVDNTAKEDGDDNS